MHFESLVVIMKEKLEGGCYMALQSANVKRGVSFSVKLPTVIKTRDEMSEKEFNKMMQMGLNQAKTGAAVPYEQAFDQLFQGL